MGCRILAKNNSFYVFSSPIGSPDDFLHGPFPSFDVAAVFAEGAPEPSQVDEVEFFDDEGVFDAVADYFSEGVFETRTFTLPSSRTGVFHITEYRRTRAESREKRIRVGNVLSALASIFQKNSFLERYFPVVSGVYAAVMLGCDTSSPQIDILIGTSDEKTFPLNFDVLNEVFQAMRSRFGERLIFVKNEKRVAISGMTENIRISLTFPALEVQKRVVENASGNIFRGIRIPDPNTLLEALKKESLETALIDQDMTDGENKRAKALCADELEYLLLNNFDNISEVKECRRENTL